MPPTVLCIGFACWDLAYRASHAPEPDEKLFADELRQSGGGPAANAAVAVVRLGGHAVLLAYLGEDPAGSAHAQELANEGIDTGFLQRGTEPTPIATALATPGGRRLVISTKRQLPAISVPGQVLDSLNLDVVLTDTHQPAAALSAQKWARQHGRPIVLDAGRLDSAAESLLPLATHLVVSERFARESAAGMDPFEALPRIGRPDQTVVITLGAQGLIWRDPDGSGQMDAFSITATDATGAGDAFHGAFSLALAEKQPLVEALRFASAAAALTCTGLTGRNPLPRRDALAALLESQSPRVARIPSSASQAK